MKKLKLWDVVYVIKERERIEEEYVIGIYNLEKIEQDRNDYFFDAPNQLIAHSNKTWIYKWPIEKHSFKNINETFTNVFDDKLKAEKMLHIYIEQDKKMKDKRERIENIRNEIEKIELE